MVVHRPTLKKRQKGFKSKHATKGAIRAENKGRIGKTSGTNGTTKQGNTMSKQDRRNLANQLKANKQASALERSRLFNGKNGVPRNIAVIPLTTDIDSASAVERLVAGLDAEIDASCPGLMYIPRYRQQLRWFIPDYTSFWELLDAARSADFVVFVLSATCEIVDYGEQIVRCIASQGMTTPLGLIWGLEGHSSKNQVQIRESLTSWFSHFFVNERLYDIARDSDVLVATRIICQRTPKGVSWRDERPYLVAKSVELIDGKLALSGHIRGQALSADMLVHITGIGDLLIDHIDIYGDEENQLTSSQTQTLDPLIEEEVVLHDAPLGAKGAGIRVDGHTYINELMEQGMSEAPATIKRLPKGISDYQASWMLESEDYGFDPEEFDDGEAAMSDEEGELVQISSRRENEEDEEMEVDELDKEGLQRFQEAQEDLKFPDELELRPEESGIERLKRYRGLRSLRQAEWDANEIDPRAPVEFTRLWRPGSLVGTRNNILKSLNAGEQAPVGTKVVLHLTGFDLSKVEGLSTGPKSSLTAYGLLPGEQKWGVVSMSVIPDSEIVEPVKSKDSVVVQVGPRRLLTRPLYSQSGHNDNNVYKFYRYLHGGRAATATVLAPVLLGNAPVVWFKGLEDYQILGTGTVLNSDANRVILKTAVLTGYPVKIHRKVVTVRYMFFNREDVNWFKAVPLFTKHGAQGVIKEPLGTHGYLKATFDRKIRANDTIAMALYKRVWPKPALLL